MTGAGAFLTNKPLWRRLGVIPAAVRLGGIIILSATSRNFQWSTYRGFLDGPAAVTASSGWS